MLCLLKDIEFWHHGEILLEDNFLLLHHHSQHDTRIASRAHYETFGLQDVENVRDLQYFSSCVQDASDNMCSLDSLVLAEG